MRWISSFLLWGLCALPVGAVPVRFPMASLSANKVSVHVGPQATSPIAWVFTSQGMPVVVMGSLGAWRHIQDMEGNKGWIHYLLIRKRPTVIVTASEARLRSRPSKEAAVVARLARHLVARRLQCLEAWCHVSVRGYKGWVNTKAIWGVPNRDDRLP